MPNYTINDLRDDLRDVIQRLKDGTMKDETARTINQTVQTIINATKVEIEMVKLTGGLGTGFIPQEQDPFEKNIPQYAIDGMKDCSFCEAEAVVRPDAPSVNNLTACDWCLKQKSTEHFRRQLAAQTDVNPFPAKTVQLTENHKEILDYLKENGGQATIGTMFGDNKTQVITRLLRLEELRYIECIQRPVYQNDFPVERRGKLTTEELHCGIWKLTPKGMKAAA